MIANIADQQRISRERAKRMGALRDALKQADSESSALRADLDREARRRYYRRVAEKAELLAKSSRAAQTAFEEWEKLAQEERR